MDANLLEAISIQDNMEKAAGTYRRAALKDIVVFGRVRCVIERPDVVPDTIEDGDGSYIILDAYALKCLGEDYFRDSSNYDAGRLYFTKGSLIAYIKNPEKWVGKDIKLLGKAYGSQVYGATIRRQGTTGVTGITAFVFMSNPKKVNRKTVYTLACNHVEELNAGAKEYAGSALEEFLIKLASSKNGEIPYNQSLESIVPYTGAEKYTVIPVVSTSNENPTAGVYTAPNLVAAPSNKVTSGVTEPVKRLPKTPDGRIDVSSIDMKLVYHLLGQPRSELCDAFKDDILRCSNSRNEWVSSVFTSINEMIEENELDLYGFVCSIRNKFMNVASDYNEVLGHGPMRCRDIVNKFISNCHDTTFVQNSENLEESRKRQILKGCDLLKTMIPGDPSCLNGSTGTEIDAIPAIQDNTIFAINVVSVSTGVSYESLTSNFNYMARNYDCNVGDWVAYLLYDPYFLGMVGGDLNMVDCDSIYYGVSVTQDAKIFKDLVMKHRKYMAMLYTLESVCEGTNPICVSREAHTFVPCSLYRNAAMHYDKRAATNVASHFYPQPLTSLACLKKMFGFSGIGVPRSKVSEFLGNNRSWYDETVLEELKEIGVVNTLESFIALEGNIEQEYSIYSVFEPLGKVETGITEEQIAEVIDEFEKEKGFKLEALQRDGIKLCMHNAGVLSGCAGSGKTTTSDCLTMVLSKYFPKTPIIYCTPTGKACRRLAEVVGGTVKTIHSQFRLGFSSSSLVPPSYMSGIGRPHETGSGVIYIMDEMAMCSTDLMFNVARNIKNNDMIYFLGDIKQLPPVGKGCPFKVLMDLLPCVELGVSKRAAAGSLINYNTTLINCLSDKVVTPLMYDDSTFLGTPCANKDLQNCVVQSFKGFLDGSMTGTKYAEDDIQVITGYQKEDKVSSTSRLNTALQKLLRAKSTLLFVREKMNGDARKYYKGDRVIYIKANSYDTCRYIPDGYNSFKTVVTLGVVNGDVGKLVGVFNSMDLKFTDCHQSDYAEGSKLRGDLSKEDVAELFSKREERKNSIRDDSSYKGKDLYFVAIQLYDTDLHTDVIVLLRARGKMVDGVLSLFGGDLDNLDLAYALTCHKMQGSQSPVVIVPLERGSYAHFINRNMINTMFTRARQVVHVIGDIEGNDSALAKGRRIPSSTSSHDLLSVLTGDMKWAIG